MGFACDLKVALKNSIKSPKVRTILIVAAGLYGIHIAIKSYKCIKREQRRKAYKKDVVYLHQLPAKLAFKAPSVSPFALKLETWLRFANIPYENDPEFEFSSKGMVPWITLNGVDVADSQFCIEYLSKNFNKDLNKDLNDEQKAVSRAVLKLTEESLRWIATIHRFLLHPDPKESGLSQMILCFMRRSVDTRTKAQGYGRHTKEECYNIGKADLKAINDIIGNKKYLCGDEVCDTDAAIFGLLAQIAYHDQGPLNEYFKTNCPNLVRYVETIKATYWSDWNERVKEKSIASN